MATNISQANSGTQGKSTLANVQVDPMGLLTIASDNAAISRSEVSDPFWPEIPFLAERWNKLYPYQLIVVDAEAGEGGKISYKPHKNAVYTLPFPPEALSRSRQFAIDVAVTLGGISEQHNGAPIEYLEFRGTTGYLPLRSTSPDNKPLATLNAYTGGAIQGTINQLAGTLTDAASFTKSWFANANNVHLEEEFTKESQLMKTSGYYQMNLLNEFLRQYVSYKKTVAGKNARLALAIWKDNETLLVTPVNFSVTKDASYPMESRYALAFKAWKRIQINVGTSEFVAPQIIKNNPSLLARVINKMSEARKIVQDVGSIPQAVLGDINHIDEVFRQSIGFCKDLAGSIQSFADMPRNVRDSVVKKVYRNGRDFREAGKQISNASSNFKKNILDPNPAFQSGSWGVKNTKNTTINLLQQKRFMEMPLTDFLPYLSAADRANISADLNRLRGLTRTDFARMRDDLSLFTARLSFLLGAGSDTYAATYGLGNIQPIKDEPGAGDWRVLSALNDSLIELDGLAATADGEPSEPARLMDSMATLARRSGVAFKVPTSKFAVPFPYGATIESLATQYLGSPNRVFEIIALNGLREPYVDETGFDCPLLTNGSGNTIIINNTQSLYIGQPVSILSSGAIKTNRKITALETTLDNKLAITLDGLGDLDRYRISDSAYLHAFLPDTVNSQSLIYIPSDKDPVENSYITKDIPGVDTTDPMVVVGGVDLLLDSTKDLVITPDGDSRYAKGLTNIIQNLEISFAVPQGKLLLHRGFGLPLTVGQDLSDVDAKSVVTAVRNMVMNDSSFSSVDRVQVVNNGNSSRIDVSATVTGTRSPLPLSFGIK